MGASNGSNVPSCRLFQFFDLLWSKIQILKITETADDGRTLNVHVDVHVLVDVVDWPFLTAGPALSGRIKTVRSFLTSSPGI